MAENHDVGLRELTPEGVPPGSALLDGATQSDSETKRSASDLEAVYDVPVTVQAILGKSSMEVSELLALGRGTVVQLDRKVGEAIDIYVNDRLVARGEVVLVEDRLGVTMTEIIKSGQISPKENDMRLLIIGSLQGQIGAATKIAMDRGARVTHASDIAQGLSALRNGQGADLIMCDVTMDIGHLVRSLASERICTPVIAAGIGTDARRAVEAIRAGAKEYVPLPPDPELIAAVLAAVADESHQLIYEDNAMAAVIALADQVAGSEASILVTGESGTGKEILARYVHRHSARADKPFISVNCAAIPENLLESELFGHEKGSFTGAIARRIGKFEEANGGTLLLDEISEMDGRLQAKLLRAIQEREIDRVGGGKPVKVDIRIIATANRDLADQAKKGLFREDLLYRLNVVNLKLPPLRERPKDILALARHFARKYAEANGTPFRPLATETERQLSSYSWRGNVRELENTIHRSVLLAHGDEIGVEAIRLPDGAKLADAPAIRSNDPVSIAAEAVAATTRSLVGRTVSEVERDLILDTLNHCLGNRTHAANILGISIRTLRNKLREYSGAGIPVPESGQNRAA